MLSVALARFEFGDALLFFYALVFVRQFLWVVEENRLAWALSVPVAATAIFFYVATKRTRAVRFGREFWLLVALPLLVVYALRAPFPDTSYDVLNYHLLHSERTLRGTLLAPGDFFPTPAPYNPATDTLTGLFRLALGYRLGTVVNLLALVWAGQVLDKILRPFVARAWARSACVLLALLAEHVLFEVNTYMVDLLALPLLLEATHLALGDGEAEENGPSLYVQAALLLGTSAALKLTNATSIAPLVVVFAYRALAGRQRLAPKKLARAVSLALAAFVAPLLPFAFYLWRMTGNPFFPLANGFFKSPYWPTGGGWDSRWGPSGALETMVWPVLSAFKPARHSELGVYSGRLAVGFVVALVGLAAARRDARARLLCGLLVAGCLLWSAGGMGYSRYGLYLELLAGVVVVAVASVIARAASGARPVWAKAVVPILFAALVAQAALACVYVSRHEWSMRPTAISNWSAYKYESRFFLRDRSLADFLTGEERARYAGLDAWGEAGVKSTGFEVLLNPRAPIVAFNHWEYFDTRESRARFVRAVEDGPGASMFSLCFPEELAGVKENVERHALSVGRVTNVDVPFFSPHNVIGMILIEIPRPQGTEARRRLEEFGEQAAFAATDYRAEITAVDARASMHAGERVVLNFRVRNAGGGVWPARGDSKGWYQVNLADRWLDAGARKVFNALDARAALPADLPPGGEVALALAVTAPSEPGDYVLEVDLVHEGVTFFSEKGSKSLRLPVRVEP
jgi:hypothetical protein